MTKLNQIIALREGEKTRANKATAPLFHTAKDSARFAGLTRTYEPVEDGGAKLPDENARVQHTVSEIIDSFVRNSTRMLDLKATADVANTQAFADVVIEEGDDRQVIIDHAPVTLLLPLEKYLQQEVRGLIETLPVLDPAQNWEPSGSERAGIYETAAVQRHRNQKVNRPLELSPATDRHPAQVQLVIEDVLAGYWTEKKFSGAIPASRKAELLARVETLIQAVQSAREQANDLTVEDKKIGDAVFNYLFD